MGYVSEGQGCHLSFWFLITRQKVLALAEAKVGQLWRSDEKAQLEISRHALIFDAAKIKVQIWFLWIAQIELELKINSNTIQSSNLSWNLSSGTQLNDEEDLGKKMFVKPNATHSTSLGLGSKILGAKSQSNFGTVEAGPPPFLHWSSEKLALKWQM